MNRLALFIVLLSMLASVGSLDAQERPRAREAGVVVGILPTGPLNAITDVDGVLVGQVTVVSGDSTRTGVTAIRPHTGNLFRERVPAAIYVGNGFGKLLGVTEVDELGELETPILLTCTLCVWRAADAMVEWLLAQPGMENVRSINPVVGETNDGGLNDIRDRPITTAQVVEALEGATGGPVEEGSVGAGTGTIAFGWKGGIGTSSRQLPASLGGYMVGVLVQTNYGGVLTINGAPVGRELGSYSFQRQLEAGADADRAELAQAEVTAGGADSDSAENVANTATDTAGGRAPDRSSDAAADGAVLDAGDGSVMIVVATDAPLDSRNLGRLATRALGGIARTGSSMSNGSGDYVIAFSTAEAVRRRDGREPRTVQDLPNDEMSPLFQAVAEATEEAVYNSLFRATTIESRSGKAEALPIEETMEILRRYGALDWDRTLPPGAAP